MMIAVTKTEGQMCVKQGGTASERWECKINQVNYARVQYIVPRSSDLVCARFLKGVISSAHESGFQRTL